jgi:hypothetical protein
VIFICIYKNTNSFPDCQSFTTAYFLNHYHIFFIIEGIQTGFYETSKSYLETYSTGTSTFSAVELFECTECETDFSVRKLYRVKNWGIIQFELVNGEVWVNKNLSEYRDVSKESFNYHEYVCD